MGHSIYNAYVIGGLQYSNFCLSRESASLYSDRFYFKNANVLADAFSSQKQTILHRYRNEIYYSKSIATKLFYQHISLILQFMKSLCVITIKLNTLTDVPYQITVGWAFVYVCENL